jgi:hypothetical protein
LLGNFHRDGVIETREPIAVNDHDFGSHSVGKLIPHGLYDVGRNEGFVNLNTSHDTGELACDSIASWWEQYGRDRNVRLPRVHPLLGAHAEGKLGRQTPDRSKSLSSRCQEGGRMVPCQSSPTDLGTARHTESEVEWSFRLLWHHR